MAKADSTDPVGRPWTVVLREAQTEIEQCEAAWFNAKVRYDLLRKQSKCRHKLPKKLSIFGNDCVRCGLHMNDGAF